MAKAVKKTKLPMTDSIEVLARFWDSHDSTEFASDFEEVTEPIFIGKPGVFLRIRLSEEEAEAVSQRAHTKGIDRMDLLREWVLEKLQAVAENEKVTTTAKT
jgi:hypothetical protein